MTEPKTKWAAAEDRVDDLKDACAPERLLARAYIDLFEEISRFAEDGRTPQQALVTLAEWTNLFARMWR